MRKPLSGIDFFLIVWLSEIFIFIVIPLLCLSNKTEYLDTRQIAKLGQDTLFALLATLNITIGIFGLLIFVRRYMNKVIHSLFSSLFRGMYIYQAYRFGPDYSEFSSYWYNSFYPYV